MGWWRRGAETVHGAALGRGSFRSREVELSHSHLNVVSSRQAGALSQQSVRSEGVNMTQDRHGARYTESQKCRRAGWRGLEKRAQRENYYPKWCKTRDNVKPRGLCQSYCTAWGGVISCLGASGGRLAAVQRTQQQRLTEGQGSLPVRGGASKTHPKMQGRKVIAWCPHKQDGCCLLPRCGFQLTDIQ